MTWLAVYAAAVVVLGAFTCLEIIRRDGDYLWRWHIAKGNWGGLYLHRFLRGDEDKDPHDHPWPFKTFVLWGGYDDEVWDVEGKTRRVLMWEHCRPGRLYSRPASHTHRVVIAPGRTAWTLVFIGRKEKEWGFYTPQGFVHHIEYQQEADLRMVSGEIPGQGAGPA